MKAPKGTQDILPAEATAREGLWEDIRALLTRWGYQPIITPVFEQTELFIRGIGADTDIVQKEMYTFPDRKGRSLTLRPEGTAPIARALLENHMLTSGTPVKLYYHLPMYRYERPQKGRMREFWQIGVELFGSPTAEADAEVITLLVRILETVGLRTFETTINSIGCIVCRPPYLDELRVFLASIENHLCIDCRRRATANPLRVFDCKHDGCRVALAPAPLITDHVCPSCDTHLHETLGFLSALSVTFVLNKRLVRGFDYYTRTTFEVNSSFLGAQSAVAAGGRYDGLVQELGGPPTPGLGFAIGVERLLLQLVEESAYRMEPRTTPVFVGYVDESTRGTALGFAVELRDSGIPCDVELMGRSLRAQLRSADRSGASLSVIIGPDEAEMGAVRVKDMVDGDEFTMPFGDAVVYIKDRIQTLPVRRSPGGRGG